MLLGTVYNAQLSSEIGVDCRSYTGLSIVSIQYLPFTPLNHLTHLPYDRKYPVLYKSVNYTSACNGVTSNKLEIVFNSIIEHLLIKAQGKG